MHRLSDQALLACYSAAVKTGADRKFIHMLLTEIKKRELDAPPKNDQLEKKC